MKHVLTVAVVLAWSGAIVAQDAVKVDPAHYTVVTENPSVRILKISYGAGEKSPMHQHPDAVVIPLTASKVRFTLPDGKAEDRDLAIGSADYTPAATHSPMNTGASRIEALLVELRAAAAGTAMLPASREGLTLKALSEGARATSYHATAAPTFQEPAGSKHDYDQVIVSLGSSQMSLSIDGMPAKTTWARGDAVFVPRGVAHESKNASGKPIEFVIVAIR